MNAIAPRSPAVAAPRPVGPVLQPQTFDQLIKFSEMVAASGLVPKDYINKPANIFVAVQMGSELGLAPMQSLSSIAVINGRPGVWGDGLIGLCRQSPLCEDIVENFEGQGETRAAVCVAKRRGSSPTTARFSVDDARRAGLWDKAGPWKQYPDRMLQNRARGFALRDAFPDLLRGLKTVEELRDHQDAPRQQQAYTGGPTIDAQPEQSASRAAPPPAAEVPSLDEPAPPVDQDATQADRFIAEVRKHKTAAALGEFIDQTGVQTYLDWLKDNRADLALKVQQAEDAQFEKLQAPADQVPA